MSLSYALVQLVCVTWSSCWCCSLGLNTVPPPGVLVSRTLVLENWFCWDCVVSLVIIVSAHPWSLLGWAVSIADSAFLVCLVCLFIVAMLIFATPQQFVFHIPTFIFSEPQHHLCSSFLSQYFLPFLLIEDVFLSGADEGSWGFPRVYSLLAANVRSTSATRARLRSWFR
jgi:hypothetical protein